MTRHARTRYIVYAFAVLVILVVARTVNHKLDDTPLGRAYWLCGQCGLSRAEVDQRIDDAAHSTLDRGGLIRLFDATFEPEDDHRELCMPCVEAISDGAGVKR